MCGGEKQKYLQFLLFSAYIWIEQTVASDSCDHAYTVDDGGWFTDEKELLAKPGLCNIQVRDISLTQEEFLEKFAFIEPVVIKGATGNEAFQNMCRKDRMLSEFGDMRIILSSANTYSYRKRVYVDAILKTKGQLVAGNSVC